MVWTRLYGRTTEQPQPNPIRTHTPHPTLSNRTELREVVARAHEEQGESMAMLRSRTRARFLPQLRACFLRAARGTCSG